MKKPIRTPPTESQIQDAARLKAMFKAYQDGWAERGESKRPSQDELGEKWGLGTQSNVSAYLRAAQPMGIDVAIKFASGMGCSVSDFSPSLGRELMTQVPFSQNSNIMPTPLPRGRVPLISWVQAGCWMEVVDNFAPGASDEWVDVDVDVRQHTFAITVRGDSMSPDFPEGMILVVEPDMQADNGDYVIARNGEHEATFKQLVIDGGIWFLKPLNERYPIMPIGQGTTIIGVVREAITKRKLK